MGMPGGARVAIPGDIESKGWAFGTHDSPDNTGQRLTAGLARQRLFWAIYGTAHPADVLGDTLQKRLPEGAVRRCPAAQAP